MKDSKSDNEVDVILSKKKDKGMQDDGQASVFK